MKFNKILSLVLAVGMLLSCMGNIAFADEAAVAEPTLVYDMDLTNYDIKTNTCIPNSVEGGSTATFTPGYNGSYRIQNMLNTNGANVPVINFIKNNSTITFESTELANKSVTLEVWANIDLGAAGWEPVAKIQGYNSSSEGGSSATAVNGTTLAGYTVANSALDKLVFTFYGQGGNTTGVRASTLQWPADQHIFSAGQWHKFTIVRDMEEADKVTHTLYCDGTKWKTDIGSARTSETSVSVTLSGQTSFDCFKIADAKIYNGVKEAADILEDYEEETATYIEKSIADSLVFDANMDKYFKNNPIPSGVTLSNTAENKYAAHNNTRNTKGSFIGANLDKISYANSKSNKDYWYFNDTALANKSYSVDAWLSVDTNVAVNMQLFEASAWDANAVSVNKAIVKTMRSGEAASKYTFGETNSTGDTYINDNTFLHLAITREFTGDGKINVKYYLNGALKKEESLTAVNETKAGWVIRAGQNTSLGDVLANDFKIADVRLYGERALDEFQINEVYKSEKDKYAYPTYTVTETCTIKDSEDVAITEPETQLENGFKFSTGITSNAKAKTVVALYKNDTLYDYKVIDYNKGTTIDATFDTVAYDATATWKIKVMLLDGFTNLYPMTKAVTYENVFATAN